MRSVHYDRVGGSGPAAGPTAGTESESGRQAAGRPRSDEAHQAILDATLELLVEVGFSALTDEGVASRAGVGKTTIYRRWPSNLPLMVDLALRGLRCSARARPFSGSYAPHALANDSCLSLNPRRRAQARAPEWKDVHA